MRVYVSIQGRLCFHIQKYWSCNFHERKLFSFVDNGRLAGEYPPRFKAPLSPQERDDQRWLSSYFFIRNGDGSSAFPESVKDRRAQRFIHHRSQLHRLFILLGRPTSEARPIKFSHSCPNACHLAHINRNTLSFSLFLSLHSWCPIYLDFSVSPSLPPPPSPRRSITFLTSNEEWTRFENYDMVLRSKLQIKHMFLSSP